VLVAVPEGRAGCGGLWACGRHSSPLHVVGQMTRRQRSQSSTPRASEPDMCRRRGAGRGDRAAQAQRARRRGRAAAGRGTVRTVRLGRGRGVTCAGLGALAILGRPLVESRSCPLLSRRADFPPSPIAPHLGGLHSAPHARDTLSAVAPAPSRPRRLHVPLHTDGAALPAHGRSLLAHHAIARPCCAPPALPIHTAHHRPRAHGPSLSRAIASPSCRAPPPALLATERESLPALHLPERRSPRLWPMQL
jgi:hypothetical protein